MLRRGLALLFALLVYLAAIGTMVVYALFAGGLFVAKTVDSGPAGSPGVALGFDVALFLLFTLPHSLMARPAIKRRIERIATRALERTVYTLVATVTLALLLWLWKPIPVPLVELRAVWAIAAARTIFVAGWLLVLVGVVGVDPFRLFGLAQAWDAFRGAPERQEAFTRSGVYAYVRHPLYAGTLLGLWAAPTISVGHVLFAGLSTLYLLIGMRFEERDLARAFGSEYETYRREVPAFLPRLYSSSHRADGADTSKRRLDGGDVSKRRLDGGAVAD